MGCGWLGFMDRTTRAGNAKYQTVIEKRRARGKDGEREVGVVLAYSGLWGWSYETLRRNGRAGFFGECMAIGPQRDHVARQRRGWCGDLLRRVGNSRTCRS